MNPDLKPQTPFQEAVSLITIVAILLLVGCYLATLNNVPFLSVFLFWVTMQIYHFFPALGKFPGRHVPMLVAATAVGFTFFVLTIPSANWVASIFNRAGVESIERQTARLKKFREYRKKRARDKDEFIVE